jgi:hypothetical protein
MHEFHMEPIPNPFFDNGTPSSSRIIMGLFSLFTIAALWRVFGKLIHMDDAMTLTVWLSNLQLIISALIALISAAYAINRGGNAISDLAALCRGKNGKDSLG